MSITLTHPLPGKISKLDITDLYVFRGETGTVFVINVCHSIFGPVPVPGYIPKACTSSRSISTAMRLRMSRTGSRLTSATSGEAAVCGAKHPGAASRGPDAAGTVLGKGTTNETTTTEGGVRMSAGKAGDPFWIEPDVLHAVGHAFTMARSSTCRMGPESCEEFVCGAHGVFDRAGSARCGTARGHRRQAPDRRVGVGHARHRRRRMAVDQPGGASDDSAAVRAV